MKSRSLFAGMALCLVVLVAVALWQGAPRPAPPTPTPTADLRDIFTVFEGIASADIQALRVDDPQSDRDLILERTPDGQWRLAGYDDDTLDQLIAENIARTVAFMPFVEVVPALPLERYADYGLTPEMFWLQIQAILKDGRELTIGIGAAAAIPEGGYFAVVDDRPDVYVLNRGAVDFLYIYLLQVQDF